jgi:hypothetical protein
MIGGLSLEQNDTPPLQTPTQPKPLPAAPSSPLTRVRKAVITVLVSGGLCASLVGVAADRIDPVAASSTPSASCFDPAHDLALTQATKENPVFELDQYAPSVASALGLPDDGAHPADHVCSQDRANVVSTIKQMITDGKLQTDLEQPHK